METARKLFPWAAAAVIAVAAAVAGAPFKTEALKASERVVSGDSVRASLGGGMLFGVLGGYRSLVSDLIWIKSYIEWEKKDVSACMASIELAASVDPYMTVFWTQGAAIIAFDTPHWLLRNLPKNRQNDEALRLLKIRQGRTALKFLDKAIPMFPQNDELLIQKGQIAIGIGDFPLAQECFGAVAQRANSSIYSRRIYASLLEKNGKLREAIPVLESVLKDMNSDSPARKAVDTQISEIKAKIEKTAS